MTFSLPSDALFLRGDAFYTLVQDCCGSEVLELLQFQLLDSSTSFLETDDVLYILQFEFDQTVSLKDRLGISIRDDNNKYSFVVMPGIRLKLEKFVRSLRRLQHAETFSPPTDEPLRVSSELQQQHPFLTELITCLKSNALSSFVLDFLAGLVSNSLGAKNTNRYQQSVKDFAASLYILGERNAYEFVRINLPGSIPSLSSLQTIVSSSAQHFAEGEFQYDRLKNFIAPLGCKYAFCGEDSTGIIPKVCYDARSNCFVGFTLPLNDGFPFSGYFSTNSLSKLEEWHQNVNKSHLLNVHVLQALRPTDQSTPSPFLLAAYGTNGRYSAEDVLKRWTRIFSSCLAQNVRILGFSGDCDPRIMKAMRDSMGFFSARNTGFEEHPNHFNLTLFQVSRPTRREQRPSLSFRTIAGSF